MTKAQMMGHFDAIVTDRQLNRDLVERHLAGSVAEPSLLLGRYVCLVSGGSSGLRGIFVQAVEGRADDLFRYPTARVHPFVIGAALLRAPAVREFQVRQTEPGVEVTRSSTVTSTSPR